MTTMDASDELDQLVRLCSMRSKTSRQFPKEENGLLAERVRGWLEQHANDIDAASDQINVLRGFLKLHDAATKGPVPKADVRCYIVIDTNIFYHHENILDRLNESCVFVLPQIVLDELANRSRTKDAKGRQSQRILSRIRQFPSHRILRMKVGQVAIRRFRSEYSEPTRNDLCDDRILATAKHLLAEKKPTRLLSDDVTLRKRAIEYDIPALSLREFFADY